MSIQTCNVCGEAKPLDAFEKQKNRPSHRKTCKSCRYSMRDREREKERHREYMRERRRVDPDAVRVNWERSVYGVAKEDIGLSCCMICGSSHRLCIDHDHSSGAVRGLLCGKCNTGIGMFNDDVSILEKAMIYLSGGNHAS